MKTELVAILKRQAARILANLHQTKESVLNAEHRKPPAYLVDIDDYELIRNWMNILEGIALGEMAVQEGRVYSDAQAKDRMSKWLK